MDQLSVACREGDIESVKTLLSLNSDALDLQKGLLEAVRAKQLPIITLLLERGVPIDEWAFIGAAQAQSPEVYECFLGHGWNINSVEYGVDALSLSTGEGRDLSIVTWLLEHGTDPNLKTRPSGLGRRSPASVMRSAIATNNLPAMRILLAHGAVLEKDLFDPCLAPWMEAETPMLETLQFLLDSGLSPNVVIKTQRDSGTPLQLAVRRDMLEKARALLVAGASQDVENKVGQTPLDEAKKVGNQAMIELLQNNGRASEQAGT